MEPCGNLNLCAGLPVSIEGDVHAMTTAWEKAMVTTQLPEEAASVDELMMAKPKIATRIRQSTYGGNSSLPRENDEDDQSNGGGGEDDEPSTAF